MIARLAAKTCWPVSQSGASAVNRPDSSTGLKIEKLIDPAGLVVLGTVAGGRVDQAGAVLDADVVGQHDRADAVDERVAIFRMLELPAAAPAELGELGDLPQAHDLGDQLGREDRLDGLAGRRVDVADAGVSSSGWTAIATLAGRVQGVVVQIMACHGPAVGPSARGTPETIGKLT